VLAGATPEQEAAAAEYGRRAGTAFQLIDDVLDYSGEAEALGKNLGDDLREGKPTLPLIRLLDVGTPTQQALVRTAIENGEGDFVAVATAIRESDALDYTRARARIEADAAIAAISSYPVSAFRDSLLEFCAFAINRDR